MKKYSYSSSGVSIDKGNQFVSEIKGILKKSNKNISKNIGGFAGLYPIHSSIKKPVLVAATDGVGTKLDLANKLKKHNTIGIDLVAMCVNDIIATKATPLFFLDYIATGKLNIKRSKDIIKGIIKGCSQSDCVLLGGETAEMPGFYSNEKYDLAGFSVGVMDGDIKITKASIIKNGDLLIGLESSGVHSNGYSLIRKILKDKKIKLNNKLKGGSSSIGSYLLRPTKIYVKPVLDLFKKDIIKRCAHITGGGITENLPRILDKKFTAYIDLNSWKLSPLYKWIMSNNISEYEMLKTFNCGHGMIAVVDKKKLLDLEKILKKYKIGSKVIGYISNKNNPNKKDVIYTGSLK